MKDGEEVALTNEHFESYKKYVRKYLKKLGLLGWDYSFRFEPSDVSLASIEYYTDGRVCYFYLSSNWNIPPCDSMIERVAFHECLELLMQEVKRFCFSRNFNETDLEKEVHSIIRALENLFFGEKELNDEDSQYKWLESRCHEEIGFDLDEDKKVETVEVVVKGED